MNKLLKSPISKYALIAALPLAVLLLQPTVNLAVLTLGERALIEARPVDPRDPLRGDYVILDYEISEIEEELIPAAALPHEDQREGGYVYVTLDSDESGVASASGVFWDRPSSGKLYMRGKIMRSWGWNSYSIDYGLGAYYVSEGTGRAIEEAIFDDDTQVLADVRILMGKGVIRDLRIVRPKGNK
jgi:uncharacterized membrane-anchored protein